MANDTSLLLATLAKLTCEDRFYVRQLLKEKDSIAFVLKDGEIYTPKITPWQKPVCAVHHCELWDTTNYDEPAKLYSSPWICKNCKGYNGLKIV